MSGGHGSGGISGFVKAWTDFDGWVDWVGGWGVSRALFLGCLFVSLYFLLGLYIPNLLLFTFGWVIGTAPIWLPIALAFGAWRAWILYIQSLYLSTRKPILLEMKIPREITKSPRAMELAFALFSISSGEATFIHRAWKGQVRPFFSFEIASFGGEIHFYIWCWDTYKSEVESAIYGQYPEVELHVVEDYASKFQFDPSRHAAFAAEWRLEGYHGVSAGDFRINAYQPRSYIDFELDKDPKEEFKIDPLATVLEFMSNIEPQEQIWVQLVIRKCGNKGILFQQSEDHDWLDMVQNEVDRIRAKAATIPDAVFEEIAEETHANRERPPQVRPSWRQTEQLRTIERHLGKYPFEFGGRGIYISGNGHLHGPTYTGMRWLWKPFGNPQYMGQLRPRRWSCDFDYPWQDVADIRFNNQLRRAFDAYRRRLFFYPPWIIPTNILTNETLASLWHPVGRAAATPGLIRIPAKKSEPPPNLPR